MPTGVRRAWTVGPQKWATGRACACACACAGPGTRGTRLWGWGGPGGPAGSSAGWTRDGSALAFMGENHAGPARAGASCRPATKAGPVVRAEARIGPASAQGPTVHQRRAGMERDGTQNEKKSMRNSNIQIRERVSCVRASAQAGSRPMVIHHQAFERQVSGGSGSADGWRSVRAPILQLS